MAKYICLEGTDGVGKGTQVQMLVDYLLNKGYKVLLTSEPGTPHLPVTMKLREDGLSKAKGGSLTPSERENIWQEIRQIHLKELIKPSLEKYDFIIQDRGILSGFSYALAQDITFEDMENRSVETLEKGDFSHKNPFNIHDKIILFTGASAAKYLQAAKDAKQEFESGDVLEAKGSDFMEKVRGTFLKVAPKFENLEVINIENDMGDRKSPETILDEVLASIGEV